jgi:tetratricopeptide (TPR) repeat protein
MNKTSFLPNRFLIRMVLLFAIGVLVCGTDIRPAYADAGPGPDPTVGGAGPYQPQKTNVQMMSETVVIEVSPYIDTASNQISVGASFNMQNQGRTEERMQVVFPLTRLDPNSYEESAYEVEPSTFVVWVDGLQVSTIEISTPAEKGYELEYAHGPGWTSANSIGGFQPDVRWAAFDVTFPVHQNVSIQVAYKMDGGSASFRGIAYILETGAGWYGKILSADIILRLPYPASEEVIKDASPGYVFSGNEIRWKKTNFEPTRDDNLSIGVINSYTWRSVLELRSKVKQNPNDSDAWYALGDVYSQLAYWIFTDYCETGTSYTLTSPYFSGLAVEAYEKAIAIRPDWGDAHFELANILWFGNKNVEKRFRTYYDNRKIQPVRPEDPDIQRVLKELKLAWSYGITGNNADCYMPRLLDYINIAITDLDLMAPATLTLTPKPATKTPTFTPTVYIAPTDTPMPSATPMPAPSQPSTAPAVLGMIIGLLIVAGVLVYSWRSKFEDRN